MEKQEQIKVLQCIKVNDMLVFEDEVGNIYQDCVESIRKICYYEKEIKCYKFYVYYYNKRSPLKQEHVIAGYYTGIQELNEVHLKEIWHRVDDTYKKVWSK